MININQKGFSALDSILAIVLVGVIGVAGYFAFQNAQTKFGSSATPSPAATTTSKASPTSTPLAADPTATWTAVGVDTGHFSFKYKPGWKLATGGQFAPGTAFLDTKDISCCESPIRMSIASQAGDKRKENYGVVGETVGDQLSKTEAVTVSGVVGTRKELIATKELEMMPPVKGEKYIVYTFYTDGRTYAAMYTQSPGQEDLSADFDLMIKNTLKLTN